MSNITDKIEQLLQEDKDFTTRQGLRFLIELINDAFKYIEKKKDQDASFETRLSHVENALDELLKTRATEKQEAKEERTFYRRAVIGGIIAILLTQWLPKIMELFVR